MQVVRNVAAAGGLISCDPNARPELMRDAEALTAMQEVMDLSFCLLPSTSDLGFLYPDLSEDDAVARLLDRNTEIIAIKRGEHGATILGRGERHDIEGLSVEEVDPTGAGDCFCGTFIALLTQGETLNSAGIMANAAGALAVTRRGPMEGNSDPAQIAQMLGMATPKKRSRRMPLIYDLLTRNLAGEAIGLPCFCTANEQVIRAVLSYAADTGFPTVIEATCNQVNQEGGYTGMQPSDFMAWVLELAAKKGVPADQLIFGGDHLGPNPWKSEPLETAMEKARELVKLYVEAGFTKIHLDASMACGGEPNPSFAQIAERAADLCAVAEAHAPDPERLIYIIGTEVPIPGGEQEEPDALDVTSVPRLQDTIQTHREAWDKRGLDKAWGRIVSVVTQPGVDFGHTSIYPFIPEKAAPLAEAIRVEQRLSYEAHSTDYQAKKALTQLVEKHFFFLKVGPELTYRFREAVWALAEIEELLLPSQTSRVRETVLETMADEPNNWKSYYHGSEREIEILKRFSYSDRIRYYWTIPKVQSALKAMIESLNQQDLPETMISQAFTGLDFGTIPKDPQMLIEMHIQRCIARYFEAAGFSKAQG